MIRMSLAPGKAENYGLDLKEEESCRRLNPDQNTLELETRGFCIYLVSFLIVVSISYILKGMSSRRS